MPNFSKDPIQQIKTEREQGYSGVLIEQGVPILERDLNQLALLPREVILEYLEHLRPLAGDSDAFRVEVPDPESRDMLVLPGRYYVNGCRLEIKGPTPLRLTGFLPSFGGGQREDIVYLDIWENAIGAADVSDTAERLRLQNSEDLGAQTSIRLKINWEIRVEQVNPDPADGVTKPERRRAPATNTPGHSYVELALVRRQADNDGDVWSDVFDLRHRASRGARVYKYNIALMNHYRPSQAVDFVEECRKGMKFTLPCRAEGIRYVVRFEGGDGTSPFPRFLASAQGFALLEDELRQSFRCERPLVQITKEGDSRLDGVYLHPNQIVYFRREADDVGIAFDGSLEILEWIGNRLHVMAWVGLRSTGPSSLPSYTWKHRLVFQMNVIPV